MPKPLRVALACLLLAIAASVTLVNARQPKPSARPDIDRIFAEWARNDSPGCALAVYENGQITYERGYGMGILARIILARLRPDHRVLSRAPAPRL